MTGAGISITRATELGAKYADDKTLRSAAVQLRRGLDEGKTIAQALHGQLRDMEFRIIEAAEKGGRLPDGFQHLTEYYDVMASARQKMLSALAYPVLLLHAATVLPALTMAVITGAPVLPAVLQSLFWIYVIIAACWILCVLLQRAGRFSVAVDTILCAIPVFGKCRRLFSLTRWYAVLHFHVVSGQRLSDAFSAAGDACDTASIAAASRKLAQITAGGDSAGATMLQQSAFPGECATGFTVAEETGSLDVETADRAKSCMIDASRALALVAEWLPRLIYFGALAYTAWQILNIGAASMKDTSEAMKELG